MFSKPEFNSRRERLLRSMEVERLDVLLIYSSKPESGYVRYYTGWESELGIFDCSLLIVAPTEKNPWTLLTNAFWDEPFEPYLQPVVITGDLPATIGGYIPARAKRIGVAPLRQFPADVYRAVVHGLPNAEVVDVKDLLLRLRAVKSEAEIALLRRIAAIADTGAEALSQVLHPGITELEAAAEVEYALRRSGSGPLIFSTLVTSGERTSRFIALPTARPFVEGDLVQLDCGPSLAGYHGDFSRCATVGPPNTRTRSLLEDTATLYEECLAALRPEKRACDVARHVLSAAQELGYGPDNLYQSPNVKPGFVGHGIGLANPDVPQLSPTDETVLETGMVVNIEVILKTPQIGSTRLEDAVVLGSRGATRLSEAPVRLWT